MKKIPFFYQKHGLTPLEKCDFNDFETISFYSQKRFLFYSTNSVSTVSSLDLTENKLKESGTLFNKGMGASFETMKNFVFIVKKRFFPSKTLLTLNSSLIFSENK